MCDTNRPCQFHDTPHTYNADTRTCCPPLGACLRSVAQAYADACAEDIRDCELMAQPLPGALYTYLGCPCAADPNAGIDAGATLGPREYLEQTWWYDGHPCMAYVRGTNNQGLACDTREPHGCGLCGPCRSQLMALVASKGLTPDVRAHAQDMLDR